jgi:nucleoside diphosphate kinase
MKKERMQFSIMEMVIGMKDRLPSASEKMKQTDVEKARPKTIAPPDFSIKVSKNFNLLDMAYPSSNPDNMKRIRRIIFFPSKK